MIEQAVKLKLDTSSFDRAIKGAASALAALVTTQTISSIIEITSRFEDLEVSLSSVFGSAEKGAQALATVKKFATETQFSVEDLSSTFIKLKAAGIEPTRELLTTFTDTAAVTTDQIGTLNAITDAFARTTGGGLGLEELNRLADRGIPVWNILGKQIGVSRNEISEIGKTAEGARYILDGLTRGLNESFGGATQNKLNSTSTLISNFWIQLRNSADVMGREFIPAFNDMLRKFTEFLSMNDGISRALGSGLDVAIRGLSASLQFLVENFDKVKGTIYSLLAFKLLTNVDIALRTMRISAQRGSGSLVALRAAFMSLIPAAGAATAAMRAFTLSLLSNPFTAFFAAITLLISYIVGSNGLVRSFKQLVAAVDYIGIPFREFGRFISTTFNSALNGLISAWQFVVDAMIKVYNAVGKLIPGFEKMEGVMLSVGGTVSTVWDAATDSVGGFMDAITKAGTDYDASIKKMEDANARAAEASNPGVLPSFENTGGIGFGQALPMPVNIEAADKAAEKAAKEEENLREQLTSRFETLQASLRTETEAELFAYEERLLALDEYHQKFNLSTDEFNGYQERINSLHQKNLAAISQRNFDSQLSKFKAGKYNELDFTKFSEKEKTKFIIEGGKEALGALAQQSKEAFMLMKGVALAEAIINTAQGVTKALAQGGIFGPLLAGIIIASGAAQIATIASQQYTGRQFGGPVSKGKSYMVGENGPEAFVPSGSGQVVSNGNLQGGGSGDVNINFNIQAVDAQGVDTLIMQRKAMITNIVREGIEQQGRRSPV